MTIGEKKPDFFNSLNNKYKNTYYLIIFLFFSSKIKSMWLALKFPPNPMVYLA